jgi:uncharacterized protein (DUF302 family)
MPTDGSAPSDKRPVSSAKVDRAVITKVSPWTMAETVARLWAVVAARGMKVFAVIDHGDEARRVGLALRDTKLFIIGSPSVSTAAIHVAPLAALDLPLRVVVWEDGYQTKISYPAPTEVALRYHLSPELATGLEAIDAWTNAVVNR